MELQLYRRTPQAGMSSIWSLKSATVKAVKTETQTIDIKKNLMVTRLRVDARAFVVLGVIKVIGGNYGRHLRYKIS